jgi:hypothetical protein
MWLKLKLKQFALALLLVNSVASANDISQLDGDWYSFKWKYGYSLSNGKGVAFATNSPNFKVGQEIVRLTAVGKNSFVGENVYKDGKFHKVKATLGPDGRLLFEGEKNVKWEMERIDPETYSSIVNLNRDKSVPQNEKKSAASAFAPSGWLICNHPFAQIAINTESREAFWGDKKTELYSIEGTLAEGKFSLKNLTGSKASFGLKASSLIFDGSAIGKCQLKKTRN